MFCFVRLLVFQGMIQCPLEKNVLSLNVKEV